MQSFSFARFTKLLTCALEVSVVGTIALRWADFVLGVRYRLPLPGSVVEAGANFGFLVLVVLFLADLWLLLTRQPRAVLATLRTLVYVILFMLSPYRLGQSSPVAAVSPNQAMQVLNQGKSV